MPRDFSPPEMRETCFLLLQSSGSAFAPNWAILSTWMPFVSILPGWPSLWTSEATMTTNITGHWMALLLLATHLYPCTRWTTRLILQSKSSFIHTSNTSLPRGTAHTNLHLFHSFCPAICLCLLAARITSPCPTSSPSDQNLGKSGLWLTCGCCYISSDTLFVGLGMSGLKLGHHYVPLTSRSKSRRDDWMKRNWYGSISTPYPSPCW